MKRSYLVFLLCIAFAVPLRASPPIGAVVQSWDIDAKNNTVTLHIVNTSGKDITAFSIKIKETYGASVSEHEYSTDTVELMLNIQDLAGTPRGEQLREMYHGNGTFQSGTIRDEVLHVQPGLTNYEATLDTVIYADKTAETTDREALDRALATRKGFATTMQMTNEIIKKALANPQDPAPQITAAKEIEQIRRTNLNAGALQSILSDLKSAPSQNTTVFLTDYVAKKERRASVLLEHAAPKVGGCSMKYRILIVFGWWSIGRATDTSGAAHAGFACAGFDFFPSRLSHTIQTTWFPIDKT